MPGRWRRARTRALDAARDEYRRLLYVAMTRAAERLIVCGTKGVNKIPEGCWHQLVLDALKPESVEAADDGDGKVLALQQERRRAAAPAEADVPAARNSRCPPGCARRCRPSVRRRARRAVRCQARTSRALPAAATATRRLRRGTLVHRLLQSLPDIPAARRAGGDARRISAAPEKNLPAEERAALADQVMQRCSTTRASPRCSRPAAAPRCRSSASVTIAGETVAVSGQVDRLVVTPDAVLIARFQDQPARRRDRFEPAMSRQLALYRALLQKIYTQAEPCAPRSSGPKSLI